MKENNIQKGDIIEKITFQAPHEPLSELETLNQTQKFKDIEAKVIPSLDQNSLNLNDNCASNNITPTHSVRASSENANGGPSEPAHTDPEVQVEILGEMVDSDDDSQFHEAEVNFFDDQSNEFMNALLASQASSPEVEEDKPKKKRKRTRKNKSKKQLEQNLETVENQEIKPKEAQQVVEKEKAPKNAKSPIKPPQQRNSPNKKQPVTPIKKNIHTKGTSEHSAGRSEPITPPRRFSHSVLRLRFSDEDLGMEHQIRPIRQPLGPSIENNGFSLEYQKSRLAKMSH